MRLAEWSQGAKLSAVDAPMPSEWQDKKKNNDNFSSMLIMSLR